MKITCIRIKNLNSLYGDFEIKLEDEPFASAGIFAITGATGAGKSTILDAITLALYGRAARYDNKPNPEHMMSRGTGECLAEVEFEVPKGRFRSTWSIKRARGKADGKIQSPQRFVYSENGTPLAQKMGEVDKIIEELTGLDVDRFFRSALLAQGDFVKFLKASPDDRALLLESLTGTSIYSELSMRAHEETVAREHELKLKEKGLENIKIFSEEERSAILKQIDDHNSSISLNNAHLAQFAELIKQSEILSKLEFRQKELKQRSNELELKQNTFHQDFHRLDLHEKGSSLFSDLKNLDLYSLLLCEKEAELQQVKSKINEINNEFAICVTATHCMITYKTKETEKSILDVSIELSQKTKELDQLNIWLMSHSKDQNIQESWGYIVEKITSLIHLRSKEKSFDVQISDLFKTKYLIEQKVQSAQFEQEKIITQHQALLKILHHLNNEHEIKLNGKTFEELDEKRSHVVEGINFLKKCQDMIESLEIQKNEVLQLNRSISEVLIENEKAKSEKHILETELKLDQDQIEELQLEREKNLLIASLNEHRQNLQPGEPCPLCGALDHPYETSLSLSESDQTLEKLKKSYLERTQVFHLSTRKTATLEENLKNKKDELERIEFKYESLKNSFIKHHQAFNKPVENTPTTLEEISKQISSQNETFSQLSSLMSNISEEKKQIESVKKELNANEFNIKLIESRLTAFEKEIQQNIQNQEKNKSILVELHKETILLEELITNYLSSYQLKLPVPGEEKNVLELLETRKKAYQAHLKESFEIQTSLIQLNAQSLKLETQNKLFKSQTEKMKQLQDFLILNENQVPLALFKSVDEGLEKINKLERSLAEENSLLEERKKEFQRVKQLHYAAEIHLNKLLSESNFASIEALRSSQLTLEEAKSIHQEKLRMRSETEYLAGQIQQTEQDLTQLISLNIPQGDLLLETKAKFQEMKLETDHKLGALAVTRQLLAGDDSNRLKHLKLFSGLEDFRNHLTIWQKLSGLIGSHDGHTFRRFAQGLSLDLLIKHANKHLSTLSSRYKLKRIEGKQLDLEILDQHQANATRPTSSLSGGESFLTSLALALGLSDLAGKNVRIDSLFIDEGFGTLDADTLETAVQALESLRSKNKTIGLISHIELLKERITTQIRVEKGVAGKSTITFSI